MFFRGGLVVLHKNFLTNFVWNGLRTKRSFPVHVEGKDWTNQISMFKSSTNQRNTGNHLGFPCPSGGKLWTPRSKFKIYCTSNFFAALMIFHFLPIVLSRSLVLLFSWLFSSLFALETSSIGQCCVLLDRENNRMWISKICEQNSNRWKKTLPIRSKTKNHSFPLLLTHILSFQGRIIFL